MGATANTLSDCARLVGWTWAVALGVGAGLGMVAQSHIDAGTAAALALGNAHELAAVRATAREHEDRLNAIIDEERKRHDQNNREQHVHQRALVAHFVGVRHNLEASLVDARGGAATCGRRIDAIAESVGELLDSLDAGRGLLEELGQENQRLAADNRKLVAQVIGLQAHIRGPERITVIGARK
jgi:hypothetical protein